MDLGLNSKVAVIMGGSSGVGLKTAQRFLEESAYVAICGRDQSRLDQAVNYLLEYAPSERIFAKTCDVTVKADVDEFVKGTAQAFGGIDILVNSAGKSIMGHFFDITDEQWEEQFQLKYFAIIYAVKAVYPYLKQKNGGRIVNINATLSKEPEPHMVATAATRAGLLNLSRTLSHEFAKDNILVNSVSLGLIKTDQWERRRLQSNLDVPVEEYYNDLAQKRKIPLGRVGEADEVASAILFLSSERASYISGTTIEVAGGLGKTL
ncbi:SDR family oxidoreductase [Alkalihalobacillus sp. BA299]|uniref:SDR family oxidoreductase n=1 Tax=Alkalihalobacillus sp. BA299 TaxID=2815938 RepID=UPI001ADA2098|nr:SDR family oxidoreductase [Alkalihalobacillus sp. BA299]